MHYLMVSRVGGLSPRAHSGNEDNVLVVQPGRHHAYRA
jgi:hypothetical protein